VFARAVIAVTAVIVLLGTFASPEVSRADVCVLTGECCRQHIAGCGKEEAVCLSGACDAAALDRARVVFNRKHDCQRSQRVGDAEPCGTKSCTLRLGLGDGP